MLSNFPNYEDHLHDFWLKIQMLSLQEIVILWAWSRAQESQLLTGTPGDFIDSGSVSLAD